MAKCTQCAEPADLHINWLAKVSETENKPQGYPCRCADCGKEATPNKVKSLKARRAKTTKCTQCNRMFSGRDTLMQHEAQMARNGTHFRTVEVNHG